MGRVAAALLWTAVGFLAAYLAWGPRALGLETALRRLAIDNDYLRAQLGEHARRAGDDEITRAVGKALEVVTLRLGEQSEALRVQTASVERLLEDRDSGLAESLESCDAAHGKLQGQLEKCLFAKAEAERAAAAAKSAAAEPRQGKQTVTETIDVPKASDPKKPGSGSFVFPPSLEALREKAANDGSAAGSGDDDEADQAE